VDDAVIGGGDFVVLRADGCFAYQLAVVVDDAAQGVTVVVDAQGEKLRKQTLAPPLDPDRVEEHLRAALRFLGQKEPPLGADILLWAIEHWDLALG
jgi:glutamyl-Q tRNA(Asp) synthetase